MNIREIPDNVNTFISKWSKAAGFCHADALDARCSFSAEQCESPIELLFVSALRILLSMNDYEEQEISITHSWAFRSGVEITPQKEIGPYRVDFFLEYRGPYLINFDSCQTTESERVKKIVVELDGHAFHDKDEKQRRYEKRRDRYLQKQGYKVFRYTGSEVFKDPFAAALECLSYLVAEPEEDLAGCLVNYGDYEG